MDECPKFLSSNPTVTSHSIYFKDHDIRIPLQLHGTIPYIPTRRPTQHELNVHEGDYLQITPSITKWDLHATTFAEQESNILDHAGNVKMRQPPLHLLEGVKMSCFDVTADFISDSHQLSLMISFLQITPESISEQNMKENDPDWEIASGGSKE